MTKPFLSFDVVGIDRLKTRTAKLTAAVAKGLSRGLYQEAEGIMTQSKELVPVDTGALRSSGNVHLPQVMGDRVTVQLGYGGPAVNYAMKVHEDLDAFHKVGMAKYLEIPFNAAKKGMAARIMKDVEAEVKKA